MKGLPTEETLREVLGRIPDVEELHIVEEEPYKLTAVLVAERWRGVNDNDRQKEVWELLLKEFPAHEQLRKINFVFTCSPEDIKYETPAQAVA